jgi:hypothetical protein
MDQNEEYLNILAIFHYVVAGVAGLCSLLPVFHLLFGLAFILTPDTFADGGQPPPSFIGWFFVIIAGTMMAIGFAFAGCVLAAGRFLARRRRYMFCLVMAAVECIFMPFGTVLGVFTIIVLVKEPVKAMFMGVPQHGR